MPESTFTHPLFGPVRFRTATRNQWIRGDAISFISGFDESDILPLQIPQLADVEGAHGGHLRFHKRGHDQLLRAFAEVANQGLLSHIKTCAGTLNRRLRRPVGGGLSKLPSNHAFAIAIDLNADDGSLGASVAPVAPIFQAHGFTWGKSFNDPMHFEVNRFMPAGATPGGVGEVAAPSFVACRQKVLNRGRPPEAFLAELLAWGRAADEVIFQKNEVFDIYSSVVRSWGHGEAIATGARSCSKCCASWPASRARGIGRRAPTPPIQTPTHHARPRPASCSARATRWPSARGCGSCCSMREATAAARHSPASRSPTTALPWTTARA